MREPQHNPFRVDRVTALPFVGRSVRRLTRRLEKLKYRGAIVAGEGRGKSTLLRAIGAALEAGGVETIAIGLLGSAAPAAKQDGVRQALNATATAVVLFDGFEQLGRWQRWLLRRRARLLVTAHGPVGLPVLARLRPCPRVFERLLGELIADVSPTARAFGLARLDARGGDVRAAFFDLYDAWADGRIDAAACSAVSDAAISAAEP